MTKDGKRTDERAREQEARDRAAHGQSLALGDTGDRQTGVERSHQGISNRPGDDDSDRPQEPSAEAGHRGGEGEDVEQPPLTEAGAPPLQEQERSSLDAPSQSGRPRDEGDDRIERSGQQAPPRSDPEAVRPPGSPSPDDNTM